MGRMVSMEFGGDPPDTPLLYLESGSGVSFMTELRVAASVSFLNGSRPVIASYSMTPIEKRSDR